MQSPPTPPDEDSPASRTAKPAAVPATPPSSARVARKPVGGATAVTTAGDSQSPSPRTQPAASSFLRPAFLTRSVSSEPAVPSASEKDLPAIPETSSSSSSSFFPSYFGSSSSLSINTSNNAANAAASTQSPSVSADTPSSATARPTLFQGLARSFSRRGSPVALRQSPLTLTPTIDEHPRPSTAPGDVAGLEAQIKHEQSLRTVAETKLTEVNAELEDLSATLFSQANEMVSSERKARADADTEWAGKLAAAERRAEARAQISDERIRAQGERIRRLEEKVKTLEVREKERSARLDRLEKAMRRTGRIKTMLLTSRPGD